MYKDENNIWSREVNSVSKLEIWDKIILAYKISQSVSYYFLK